MHLVGIRSLKFVIDGINNKFFSLHCSSYCLWLFVYSQYTGWNVSRKSFCYLWTLSHTQNEKNGIIWKQELAIKVEKKRITLIYMFIISLKLFAYKITIIKIRIFYVYLQLGICGSMYLYVLVFASLAPILSIWNKKLEEKQFFLLFPFEYIGIWLFHAIMLEPARASQ